MARAQSRRSDLPSRGSRLGSPSWVRCVSASSKGPDLITHASPLDLARPSQLKGLFPEEAAEAADTALKRLRGSVRTDSFVPTDDLKL